MDALLADLVRRVASPDAAALLLVDHAAREIEIVEIRDHPWFLGCQFHPEFKSRPLAPHPLFRDYIRACGDYKRAQAKPGEEI